MSNINWFPGHMTKALRMMEENISLCDGALLVLDARAPLACINQKLLGVFGQKPVLYVLNKCDLVEKAEAAKWMDKFKSEGKYAIAVDANNKRDIKALIGAIFDMFREKLKRNKEKGIFKPMRVMVSGIPNTGKSTIINSISGGKKAATGDKAGVTKGKQWIRLDDIELLDTPGTMPPSFDDQVLAAHLAYIGSINDDILDFPTLACGLLEEISKTYPSLLEERYGLSGFDRKGIELLNDICEKRGFKLKGNELDYERAARAVFDDFRKGRTGKIILERADYYSPAKVKV